MRIHNNLDPCATFLRLKLMQCWSAVQKAIGWTLICYFDRPKRSHGSSGETVISKSLSFFINPLAVFYWNCITCLGKFVSIPSGCPKTLSSNAVVPNIFGGVESHPNAWPWMVLISGHFRNGTASALCGGTLISDRHVLTAAHCIHG